MKEAESRYLAIRAWLLSFGVALEDAIRDFQYRQWGGSMQKVSSSSMVYAFL
jgi:hypothetical protein